MHKKLAGSLTGLLIVGVAAATPAIGASSKDSHVTLRVDKAAPAFHGTVESSSKHCIADRRVKVLKKKRGRTRVISRTNTDRDGAWRVEREKIGTGVFIAKVKRKQTKGGIYCGGDRSGNVRVK